MKNKYHLYLKLAKKESEILAQEMMPEEEEEGGEGQGETPKKPAGGGGGGKKDIPGEWIEFYNEVGDERIQNPLTGRVIKWKTMITYREKDPKISKMVQEKFDKWKEAKFAQKEKEREQAEEASFDKEKALEDYKKEKEEGGEVEIEEGYSIREETKELVGKMEDPELPSQKDIDEALQDPEKRKNIRDRLETHLFRKELDKKTFSKLRKLLNTLNADEDDLENLLSEDPSLAKGLIEKSQKETEKKTEKEKKDREKREKQEAVKSQKKVKKSVTKKLPVSSPEEVSPVTKKMAKKIASKFLSGERILVAKKGKGWSGLPKGWTQESFDKFYKKITEGGKDPFYACVEKMKGKIKKPEAFCAATLDKYKGTTDWRSEGKKKSKKKKKTASDYYRIWAESLMRPPV